MLALIGEIRKQPSQDTLAALQVQPGAARGKLLQINSDKMTHAEEQHEKEEDEEEEDPWINLTTGTWPSPYFLLWADSIWRGSGDLGYLEAQNLDGLSPRQNWIVWRESKVYQNVVRRADWFPLSQLMIHGVVLGSHGEAGYRSLQHHTELDFAQETWSFVGMGLQLQELYISPPLMKAADWDVVAEATAWSRKYAHVLRDSHWAFGNFRPDLAPYAVASWQSTGEQLGVLLLRNPRPEPQATEKFTLTRVLELPKRLKGLAFDAETIISLHEGPPRESCPLSSSSGGCSVSSTQSLEVQLEAGEVLILLLRPRPDLHLQGAAATARWLGTALVAAILHHSFM